MREGERKSDDTINRFDKTKTNYHDHHYDRSQITPVIPVISQSGAFINRK